MISAWECHELAIPMRRPFVAAHGSVGTRRTVLVGVHAGGHTGWGEAAPYPGVDGEGTLEVWDALAAGPPFDSVAASAAWSEAERDLEARRRGVPLWADLGATGRPVAASLAIGIGDDAPQRLDDAVARGYRAVKLKIAPGADVDVVGAIRRRHPALIIGVDANGSYRPEDDDAVFRALDALGVAYVEQPYPAGAEEAAARLRSTLDAAVALDESIRTVDDGVAVITRGAADLLVLKPARLGIDGVLALHGAAIAAGLRVKISGMVETGIGRAHALALAGLDGAVHSDVARPEEFLVADPTTARYEIVDGRIAPLPGPGIGVTPDLDATTVVRSMRRDVR